MRKMKLWRSGVVAALVISMLTSLLTLPLTALSPDAYDTGAIVPPLTVDPNDPPTTVEPDDPNDELIDPPGNTEGDEGDAGDAPQPDDTGSSGDINEGTEGGEGGSTVDPSNPDGEGNEGGEGGSTVDPSNPDGEGNEGGEGGSTVDPSNPDGEGNEGGEGGSTVDPSNPDGEGNEGGEGGSTVDPSNPDGEGNEGGEGGSTTDPSVPPADDTEDEESDTGLLLKKNEAGTEYSVTGYKGSATNIAIPELYNKLPIASIGEKAFADCDGLSSITFLYADTDIFDSAETIPDTVVIYGYIGSTAQVYAEKYGRTFVYLGTQGLVFTLNSSETGYTVTDYTGKDIHVVIPVSYMGLPVTKVVKGALTDGQVGGSGEILLPSDPVDGGTIKPTFPTVNKIKSVTLLSSTVALDGSKYTMPTGAIIYGYSGSTAATYALRYSMTFVALDGFTFELDAERTCYRLTAYEGNTAEIVIPATYLALPVAVIGKDVFRDQTNLVSVSIPEGVVSIESGAFYGCKRMTSVHLPSTLEQIEKLSFGNCGLTAIEIPVGTINVEPDAFVDCMSVTSITVDEANTVYHAQGNCLIETASKTLVMGCGSSEVPTDGSVTSIGVGAFSQCLGMMEITLSEHITLVNERAFGGYTDLMGLYFTSPNTEIFDDAATIPESTVIYGYAGSTAQAYAEKYGREFVEIPAYTLGDIDGVEGVDTDDAIYLLFHSFYPTKYPVNQSCDFNQDGLVDEDDAIYLLFYTFYPEKYPLS